MCDLCFLIVVGKKSFTQKQPKLTPKAIQNKVFLLDSSLGILTDVFSWQSYNSSFKYYCICNFQELKDLENTKFKFCD